MENTKDKTQACLNIGRIIVDETIQQRVQINPHTIADYASAIDLAEGEWPFPAVVVFRDDDGQYLLADGFHRVAAATDTGLETVPADIHDGSRYDATMWAVHANTMHGLPRSNADKRKAIRTCFKMLSTRDFDWSDRQIANFIGVHHKTVGKVRSEKAELNRLGKSASHFDKPPLGAVASRQPKSSAPTGEKRQSKPVIRRGKDGRTINVANIQAANQSRSKPKPAVMPMVEAQKALHRFGGACQDLRQVTLTPREKFKIATLCRDALIWCLPELDPKDRDLMLEKLCAKARESDHAS